MVALVGNEQALQRGALASHSWPDCPAQGPFVFLLLLV